MKADLILTVSIVWCAMFLLSMIGSGRFLEHMFKNNWVAAHFKKPFTTVFILVSFFGAPYFFLRFTFPMFIYSLFKLLMATLIILKLMWLTRKNKNVSIPKMLWKAYRGKLNYSPKPNSDAD